MSYPYFKLGLPNHQAGGEKHPRKSSVKAEDIDTLDRSKRKRDGKLGPEYHPSEDLAHAVNVALALGIPLLLTGEPGVGKTDLARVLGEEHDCPVHRFDTQSTSEAKDLFYTYDSLTAFRKTDEPDHRAFTTYNALGLSILEAFERGQVDALLHPKRHQHQGPRRSIVLIDEIDKAPRDFPNDLLNQIDKLYFRVPELDNQGTPGCDDAETLVSAKYRPILIITSNSEKTLPEAFLRRCVYFNIEFPEDEKELERIIVSHIGDIDDGSPLLTEAVSLFLGLRNEARLQKKPSTAELLNWIDATIRHGGGKNTRFAEKPELVQQTLCALVKTREDRELALSYLKTKGLSPSGDEI